MLELKRLSHKLTTCWRGLTSSPVDVQLAKINDRQPSAFIKDF